MKLPAIQFYPADWKKDPGVQSLSPEEKGVWIEILFLMHECEPRGYLTLNGKSMPLDALARLIRVELTLLNQITTLLIERGVMKVNPENGLWYNKRMVDDERIRSIRQNCGKLGGNPVLLNQNKSVSKKRLNRNTTPSSSVSSSISSSEVDTPTPFPFDGRLPQLSKAKAKTIEEVKIYCLEIGGTENDGEYLWNQWEGNGWKNNKEPIKDWKAVIRSRKLGGYLQSQKAKLNQNGYATKPPKIAF